MSVSQIGDRCDTDKMR